MGCDIHIYGEYKENGVWKVGVLRDFVSDRDYNIFSFLAGVRNYSEIEPISKPRGLPKDISPSVKKSYKQWMYDAHSCSWLTIKELEEFDYDMVIEDRRYTQKIGNGYYGGSTIEMGKGLIMTYREYLGTSYFDILKYLSEVGFERIVFWFDN